MRANPNNIVTQPAIASVWRGMIIAGVFFCSLPAQAASFDCAKAVLEVERMICNTPEISKLDEELAASYKTALKIPSQSKDVRQAQRQWLIERNNCKDAACVKHIFETRISELKATSISGDFVKPGTYKTEGDWGALVISNDESANSMRFSIDALGGNAHVCNVEGKIERNLGYANDDVFNKAGDVCVIQFENHTDRISVVVTPEREKSCRKYCGMSVWIEGDYFPENPYCESEADIRAEFIQLFKKNEFHDAKQKLAELFEKCGKFMYWLTEVEVRNDLAVTERQLGNEAACLKMLEPIKEFAMDQEKYFVPVDEEWGQRMLKKTRENWISCGGVVR